jgi:hypothetical protein
LDDWGPEPLTAEQRRDLLEIVEDRYNCGSLIITSQVPIDRWYEIVGDPTLADAILDGLFVPVETRPQRRRKAPGAFSDRTEAGAASRFIIGATADPAAGVGLVPDSGLHGLWRLYAADLAAKLYAAGEGEVHPIVSGEMPRTAKTRLDGRPGRMRRNNRQW